MSKEQLLRELEKVATNIATHKNVMCSLAYELGREVWSLWWKVKENK